jgi:choline dehydrogenase-like flavoprotein
MPDFIDLRTYDGPLDIECDVCIAGAGAAGITLARELARPGVSVVMLEAGGRELDGATQLLYSGTNTGIRYFDLTACRLRYFGGTTNHWGGRTNYHTPLDFEGMPDVGLPSWPLSRDELIPQLSRAAEMLQHDFGLYEPIAAVGEEGHDSDRIIESHSPQLRTIPYLSTPRRRFAPEFRAELEVRDGLRVFLYANLAHIQLEENGAAVQHFLAKTLDGKELRIRARAHVLACHAIENARLLLASNDVQTSGIGNAETGGQARRSIS